jgi:SAM-dependent methyltransferase
VRRYSCIDSLTVNESTPLDPETTAYFDSSVPEYSIERLRDAAHFIKAHQKDDASLIDIGAGTGNTLAYLSESTRVSSLAALDVSGESLRLLRDRVACEIHQGSILDRDFVDAIGSRFDFAIVAAVLHHLIGRSRSQSRAFARIAVENSKRLIKPGGYLIIHEPVFSPQIAMSGVFYLKKAVTRFTGERVGALGYWNNVGAPVVSYYTTAQLRELAHAGAPATLVHFHSDPGVPSLVNRLLNRESVTLAAHLDS